MAHKIKEIRIAQVLDALKVSDIASAASLTKNSFLRYDKSKNDVHLHIGLIGQAHIEALGKIPDSEIVKSKKGEEIVVTLPKTSFVTEVVNTISSRPNSFWRDSPLVKNIAKQKVLVEFSSPNIAKPFHMGHFRSTIIGNFVSNVTSCVGHDTVKINYLGDWGTQFGLLNVGLEMNNVTDDEIAANPIKVLYEAYVSANKEVETNPALSLKAREIFSQMEKGNFKAKERWERIRQFTVDELRQTYLRLGITFDEYQWESMFGAQDIALVIKELEDAQILIDKPDGKRVVKLNENRNVTVVKSDGSTLYLTRDIAAAKYRYAQHKFDKLHYVVENSQGDHFIALKHILNGMSMSWSDRINHVKFGRIHGMSTRKGEAVFLKDILDEACERARQGQKASKNTKTNYHDESSDALGLSAVIINDMKQRRQKDYKFDWEKALQMQGDGGIKLQYTHCRLCSLEEQSATTAAVECDGSLLTEPVACILVAELARFDEVLEASYSELEPCILVNYLFTLSNIISQAFKHLQVKDQPTDVASQRLMLFGAARNVLGAGMRILGVEPLQKM